MIVLVGRPTVVVLGVAVIGVEAETVCVGCEVVSVDEVWLEKCCTAGVQGFLNIKCSLVYVSHVDGRYTHKIYDRFPEAPLVSAHCDVFWF